MEELLAKIASLETSAEAAIDVSATTSEIRALEIQYLGKNGEITGNMKLLGTLSPADRPAFGLAINLAKSRLEKKITDRMVELRRFELEVQLTQESIDITMPGPRPRLGRKHVLQQTADRVKKVLGSLGFVYVETPELEDFRYNFDALNYPPDHPAMDEQDTFYVSDELVLRTQCTAFQGRLLEKFEPPFRFFTVGRTYRNETVDRTHSHTFHQIDVFMVDEGISLAHLKGTLGAFAREMFGSDVKVRFRPDFFPFVEPGVDYAISTPKLFNGKWVELGGAGLVHPNILSRYGIDTERYTGFAFGLGLDRIPMMSYGIDDLRHLLDNDMRFLEQFS